MTDHHVRASRFRPVIRSPVAAALACALASALSGCAVGPDFRRPEVAAPAPWSGLHDGHPSLQLPAAAPGSAAPAPGPVAFWTVFRDAALDRLIAQAVSANADVRTAVLRRDQARAQARIAAAQGLPTVQVRGGVVRQRISETGAQTRVVDSLPPAQRESALDTLTEPFTDHQVGFDAGWELDLWGRARRREASARALAEAAGSSLEDARLSVTAEVARLYFSLRAIQEQIGTLGRDLDAARQRRDVLAGQHRAGLIEEGVVAQQRVRVDQLAAELPTLRLREAEAISQLGLLVDAPPGTLQGLLEPQPPVDVAALPAPTLALPAELARGRPDVRAAEARLRAATADIGVAVADLYPQLTLTGSFGVESTAAGSLLDWASRGWSVGPQLLLPLFDGGRRRATVALREHAQQQAAIAFQRTVVGAWHDVDRAISRYRAARLRAEDLASRLASAERVDRLASARFRSGLSDYLAVIDAQRSVLEARRDESTNRAELLAALVAVYKAVGGDGSAPLPTGATGLTATTAPPHAPGCPRRP